MVDEIHVYVLKPSHHSAYIFFHGKFEPRNGIYVYGI